MARNSKNEIDLAELVQRSEAARLKLGEAHHELKEKLNIPLRVKSSIKSQPMKWLGISAGVGLVGSFFMKSKKKKRIQRQEKQTVFDHAKGLFPAPTSMLFSLVKPALKVYVAKLLSDLANKHAAGNPMMNRSRAPEESFDSN